MKKELKKALAKARPPLRKASPLAFWIVLILGMFNLTLGTSFLFSVDQTKFTSALLIVNEVFTFEFWGTIFGVLGLIKLYSIFRNDWDMTRRALLAGIAINSTWAIALTIRAIADQGTVLLNLLWITLAFIQITCYVFFLPPAVAFKMNGDHDAD